MPDLRERVQEIFRDIFDDPTMELRDEWQAADVDGWDSLRHIDLVVAIEKAFGIRFAMAEISRTKDPESTIGTLLGMIQGKVAARR